MFGKVFCLYLVMLLFVITVTFYAWLSRMNSKMEIIWRQITSGIFCLSYSATLFHFCNYAHHFANIVRHHKTLFEHIYVWCFSFMLLSRMKVSNEDLNTVIPPGTNYEFSIPEDVHSPNTVRTANKVSCASDKLL